MCLNEQEDEKKKLTCANKAMTWFCKMCGCAAIIASIGRPDCLFCVLLLQSKIVKVYMIKLNIDN